MVGIQKHQEGIVNDWVPFGLNIVNSITDKLETQRMDLCISPVIIGHFSSVRPIPG
jgi:hypothetical protein